jgi:hypothetical protein
MRAWQARRSQLARGSEISTAEIIYTPTNVTVQAPGETYNLDLNNDGATDFIFHGFGDGMVDAFIEIDVTGGREGVQYWQTCNGTLGTYCSYAAALPRGARFPHSALRLMEWHCSSSIVRRQA